LSGPFGLAFGGSRRSVFDDASAIGGQLGQSRLFGGRGYVGHFAAFPVRASQGLGHQSHWFAVRLGLGEKLRQLAAPVLHEPQGAVQPVDQRAAGRGEIKMITRLFWSGKSGRFLGVPGPWQLWPAGVGASQLESPQGIVVSSARKLMIPQTLGSQTATSGNSR